jgi:predicted phage-related endonuclease
MANITVNNEAEWLAIREQHIGGSEITSLFYEWLLPNGEIVVRHMFESFNEGDEVLGCLGSFRTGYRMYMEKGGLLMPEDFGESDRVQAGKFLEPAIAAWAKDRWQWDKLQKVRRYMTHDDVMGWGASLDYEINVPGRPPVEFKNIDYGMFKDKWELDEDDQIVGMPLQYQIQVQHEIGASGADHGYIVACVGGNKLYRGRIDRHEPTQERIAEAILAFWAAAAEGIVPTWLADFDTVKETHANGLKDKTVERHGMPELDVLIRRFNRWDGVIKRLTKRAENIKAQIAVQFTDESTVLVTDEHRCTWPSYTRPAGWSEPKYVEGKTWRLRLTLSKLKPPKAPKKTTKKAPAAAPQYHEEVAA